MRRLLIGLGFLCLAAACSGGGGGGGSAVPPITGPQAHSVNDTIRLTFPSGQDTKRRAVISPNTASFTLQVYTVDGATPNPRPTPLSIALSNPSFCTTSGGSTTCSVTFPVPIATAVIIQILTSDAGGNEIGGGFAGPIDTTQATIPAQNVTIGGLLATISLGAAALSAGDDGTSHQVTFTVTGKDADGNTILPPGSYPNPISFGITGDPNASLSLSPSSIFSPGPSGSTKVTLTYNSAKALTAVATLSASATGATGASLTFAPIIFTPTSLPSLLTGGSSSSVTVSEPGYAGAFTVTGTSSVATVTCVPANCTPGSAGGSVTINVSPGTAGTESVSVTDTNGGFANIPISVTSSGGTIPIAGAETIYEYATSGGGTNYGITVGPDGQTLWYVDRTNFTIGAVVNPSNCNGTQVSCAITEVPNPQATTSTGLQAITSGSDGNIYYTGVFNGADDGATFQATCTAVPSVSCSNANYYSYADGAEDLLSAPDGNLYVASGYGTYGYIYASPTAGCCSFTDENSFYGGFVNWMALDPGSQYIWFTDTGDGNIGDFSIPCNYCFMYEEPSGNVYGGGARHRGPPGTIHTGPRKHRHLPGNPFATPLNGIIAGPDGNLYVAEAGANEIDQLNPSVWLTCSSTGCTYASILPTIEPSGATNAAAMPQNFAVGPDGNVWFTDTGGYVGFISMRACAASACAAYEYYVGGAPWGITKGPDGNIWFTDSSTNKIGEVVLQ